MMIDCLNDEILIIPNIPESYLSEESLKKRFKKYYTQIHKSKGQSYRLSIYRCWTDKYNSDKSGRLIMDNQTKTQYLNTLRCMIYKLSNSYIITCIAYDKDCFFPFDQDTLYIINDIGNPSELGKKITEALHETKTIRMPEYSIYATKKWLNKNFGVKSYSTLFHKYNSCSISLYKDELVIIHSKYDSNSQSLIENEGNKLCLQYSSLNNETLGEMVTSIFNNITQ